MPIYQLPNGKVVNLSIDDLLNMTDEDEQFLIGSNIGDYPSSHMHGSAIKRRRKSKKEDFYNKDGLDYEQDSDEMNSERPLSLEDLPDEDSFDSSL